MQLQEAVQIIQAKFVAETQEKSEGPEIDAYHDAFEKYPVVMEVATQFVGDQIIQQHYEARKAAVAQAQAAGGRVYLPLQLLGAQSKGRWRELRFQIGKIAIRQP